MSEKVTPDMSATDLSATDLPAACSRLSLSRVRPCALCPELAHIFATASRGLGVKRVRTTARMCQMEIGLYTFGELTPHWSDGKAVCAEQRLRDILAAGKLADAA